MMQQDPKYEYKSNQDNMNSNNNNSGNNANSNMAKVMHSNPSDKLQSISMPHMRPTAPPSFQYAPGNMPPLPAVKPLNDNNELFQLAMEGSHDNLTPFFTQIHIYPCGVCDKPVGDDQDGILCEVSCNRWFHRQCTGLLPTSYEMLTKEENAAWACDNCIRYSQIQARFPRHPQNS